MHLEDVIEIIDMTVTFHNTTPIEYYSANIKEATKDQIENLVAALYDAGMIKYENGKLVGFECSHNELYSWNGITAAQLQILFKYNIPIDNIHGDYDGYTYICLNYENN